MTAILLDNSKVRTFNSNSTTTLSLELNDSGVLILPSALANCILSFNFTLAGTPVISGMTGTLVITGQYLTGRSISLGSINLATTTYSKILGKYTQINVELTALTNADTLIIYADQNLNIV